jgi:hypothetical protein
MFRTLLGISCHNSDIPKSQFDMGNAGLERTPPALTEISHINS